MALSLRQEVLMKNANSAPDVDLTTFDDSVSEVDLIDDGREPEEDSDHDRCTTAKKPLPDSETQTKLIHRDEDGPKQFSLFKRPASFGDTPGDSFNFTMPQLPNLNFSGTRKPSTINTTRDNLLPSLEVSCKPKCTEPKESFVTSRYKNPDEQLSQLFSSTQAPVISRQEVPHGSTEQSLSVNQIIDGEASKDIKRIAASNISTEVYSHHNIMAPIKPEVRQVPMSISTSSQNTTNDNTIQPESRPKRGRILEEDESIFRQRRKISSEDDKSAGMRQFKADSGSHMAADCSPSVRLGNDERAESRKTLSSLIEDDSLSMNEDILNIPGLSNADSRGKSKEAVLNATSTRVSPHRDDHNSSLPNLTNHHQERQNDDAQMENSRKHGLRHSDKASEVGYLTSQGHPHVQHSSTDTSARHHGPSRSSIARSKANKTMITQASSPFQSTATSQTQLLYHLLELQLKKDFAETNKFNESRQKEFKREIDDLVESGQRSHLNLKIAENENGRLQLQLQAQKDRIIKYEEKIVSMKKFLSGIGNDLQSLREEEYSRHSRYATLVAETISEHQAIRLKLQSELNDFVTGHTKREGEHRLKLQQSLGEVQSLQNTQKMLEEQLLSKDEELSQARERLKTLETSIHTIEIGLTSLHEESRFSQDALLEKLKELLSQHGMSTENARSTEDFEGQVIELLQNLRDSLSLNARDMKGAEDRLSYILTDVQSNLNACSKKVRESSKTSNVSNVQLRKQFEELKSDFYDSQSLQASLTALREKSAKTQAQLDVETNAATELRSSLKIAVDKEKTMELRIAELESNITSLQRTIVANDETADAKVTATESEVARLTEQIKKEHLNLQECSQNLTRTRISEEALKTQVQKMESESILLNSKITALETKMSIADTKADENLNEMRKSLALDANRLHQSQKAEYDNKLHQSEQKRLQLEQRLKATLQELGSLNGSSQDLSEQMKKKDVEILNLKMASKDKDTEIQRLIAAADSKLIKDTEYLTKQQAVQQTEMTEMQRKYDAALLQISTFDGKITAKDREWAERLSVKQQMNDREQKVLQANIDEMKRELDKATTESSLVTASKDLLESERDKLLAESVILQESGTTRAQALETMQHNYAQLKGDKEDIERQLMKVSNQLDEIKKGHSMRDTPSNDVHDKFEVGPLTENCTSVNEHNIRSETGTIMAPSSNGETGERQTTQRVYKKPQRKVDRSKFQQSNQQFTTPTKVLVESTFPEKEKSECVPALQAEPIVANDLGALESLDEYGVSIKTSHNVNLSSSQYWMLSQDTRLSSQNKGPNVHSQVHGTSHHRLKPAEGIVGANTSPLVFLTPTKVDNLIPRPRSQANTSSRMVSASNEGSIAPKLIRQMSLTGSSKSKQDEKPTTCSLFGTPMRSQGSHIWEDDGRRSSTPDFVSQAKPSYPVTYHKLFLSSKSDSNAPLGDKTDQTNLVDEDLANYSAHGSNEAPDEQTHSKPLQTKPSILHSVQRREDSKPKPAIHAARRQQSMSSNGKLKGKITKKPRNHKPKKAGNNSNLSATEERYNLRFSQELAKVQQ